MSKLIILVDSSGILHSCFHGYANERMGAIGNIGSPGINEKRMDVAAIYGYLHRTRKIASEMHFDELIHILDPDGGSNYRYNLYPEYKAGRSATHPSLSGQKSLLQPVLEAFGQTCVKIQGVESDDIIATLAKKYSDRGDIVLVISQDKDLMQIVKDGKVSLARYLDNGGPTKSKGFVFYEEKEVIEEFGVRPDQIADFLAICGDKSDNIPGVYKVAEVTSAKWINEYGDIANLVTNAAAIKGVAGENLRKAIPVLPLYKKLTTTLDNLDIDFPQAPTPTETMVSWLRRTNAADPTWPDDLIGDILDNEQEQAQSNTSQSPKPPSF